MNVDPSKVNLSEKDIEDWLWEHPEAIDPDLKWISRQLEVPSGIIDLLGLLPYNQILVCEVKNVTFDPAALTQVSRYAHDIERIIYYRQHEEWFANKMVIALGSPTNKIQYEADAIDVVLLSFTIDYSVNISNKWHWSETHQQALNNRYKEISAQEIFDVVAMIQEETPNEDIKEVMIMSATILAETEGFTPLIDNLVSEFGITTAAVFGRVWRYCQMEDKICYASTATLGSELDLSPHTISSHLDKLVDGGYLDEIKKIGYPSILRILVKLD